MIKIAFLLTMALGLGGCYLSANTALGPNIARARDQNAPILIYALGVPGQVLVPGSNHTAVPVYVQFLVTSKRPIALIHFALLAYSQRGYPVLARDGKQLQMVLIGPGTFDPDKLYEVNSFHSRPTGFPGGSVACVELSEMTITYADGASKKFTLPHLNITLTRQLRRGCIDQGPVVDKMFTGDGS